MKTNIKSLLLPFYFGSIDDQDRTRVERVLLTDTESLVDYLDLKRSLEAAEIIPRAPSPDILRDLQQGMSTKKKVWLTWSLGAAAAMILIAVFLSQPSSEIQSDLEPGTEILFDSRTELPANSNVL